MLRNPYSFEELIAPISLEDFFQNYWEKKPLLLTHGAKGYQDCVQLQDVEELLFSEPYAISPKQWVRFFQNKKICNAMRFLHGETGFFSKESILDGRRCGRLLSERDSLLASPVRWRSLLKSLRPLSYP